MIEQINAAARALRASVFFLSMSVAKHDCLPTKFKRHWLPRIINTGVLFMGGCEHTADVYV
jgi:hypothetical protein